MDTSPATASPILLEYGKAPPRRGVFIITGVVTALLLLVISAYRWGPGIWTSIQVRYYQRQCGSYSLPAETVVYEEDPQAAAALLANRSVYEPFRWDAWLKAKMPAPAASRICACFEEFEILNQRRMGTPGGTANSSTLFMHTLTARTGERRLVRVCLDAYPFSCWAFVLDEDGNPPNNWIQANRSNFSVGQFGGRSRISDQIVVSPPRHPPNTRIYAGQLDPADTSHFTIRYRMWDQEDVLDGYLKRGDTVEMAPRNPPSER